MIEFYHENDITDPDNAKLMALLQTCFPATPQFKEHRFYLEPPASRWLIRRNDRIIANAVVYDRTVSADEKPIRIAGIGDVCVHPDHRGKGLVGQLLSDVHTRAQADGFAFALLFGKTQIYRSSGYLPCTNEFKYITPQTQTEEIKKIDTAHYFPLTNTPWPASLINLRGPLF